MKRILTVTACLALAALHAPHATAQQAPIKPGLWHIEMSMFSDGKSNPLGEALQRLQEASMTPEERKELAKAQAELAARGTELTGSGMRTRECLTKERIARFDILGENGPKSCTQKTSPAAGGVDVALQCTDPEMKLDISLKYQGEKAYTFEAASTMPIPGADPIVLKSSGSGKWLGSDCGKFKPAPAKK